jgi:hypothetical protein
VEVTRQEKEIESVRAREDRDRKLLESGSVPAKQVADIEHELQSLQRRQTALEDDLLELMERREALELDAQRTGAEVDKAEAEVAEAVVKRDEAFKDLDTTKARRDEDRAKLLPKIPEDLLKLYEKVRAHKGIGAALLRARRCGACQLDSSTAARSARSGWPRPTRSSSARTAGRSWSGRRSRACDRPTSSSRPTAVPGATRAPRATARWSRTPRPARCWPRTQGRSASPPTTSPSTRPDRRAQAAAELGRPHGRPDGLQARGGADVRPLEDQAPALQPLARQANELAALP